MVYTIKFTPIAQKELGALPEKIKTQVFSKILALADNPRPANCKKLASFKGFYRIRSGDYRVVYQIADRILVILVVRVGHRGSVYKKVPKPDTETGS